MTCTFFGSRAVSANITEKLRMTVIELIEGRGVNEFFVGNQGEYDQMVQRVLSEVCPRYPRVRYSVVLAYLPEKRKGDVHVEWDKTVYPEAPAFVPPRYAILKRNRWMLDKSHVVVCHATNVGRGAWKFRGLALKLGKEVIDI